MPLVVLALALPALAPPQDPALHFERVQLAREFFSEGATAADFDRDGHVDVVSGPWLYRGPDFKVKVELYPPEAFDPSAYSDNFFAWSADFDQDGWRDVLTVGFPGLDATWLENPGETDGLWVRHHAFTGVDDESPEFLDLTGDGVPELVCAHGGSLGWASPDPSDPFAPWIWNQATPDMGFHRFTHGLGAGDVDGDGRLDLLERTSWWEQPATLGGLWERHRFTFGNGHGGAQMFAYDVDGDGDNDVISSISAHGFGLSWFEHRIADGGIVFDEHVIMGTEPDPLLFAELHAVALVDVDRDGLKDIVTGKRWWSHGAAGDPMPGSPAVVAWFQLQRLPGGVRFHGRLVDDDSGVGTQLSHADVDADGRVDFVIGNKRGTFVLFQREGEAAHAGPPPPQGKEQRAEQNLDFESGDLSHWTAEGPAFQGQPVRGDTVSRRGRESSRHAGTFWIGGYEKAGDEPQGTLTSDWFVAAEPWASFLVGGGTGRGERVELWCEGAGAPFFTTSGANYETLQRVVAPLASVRGKRIRVRLVDEESGGWGHLNFDDFRQHAEEPRFERPPGTPPILPLDPPKAQGLSAQDAARAMTVPSGFHVDVIASEPDLHQPIALAIDAKGRLWVAEAFAYPTRAKEGEARDDVVVFEDADQDGSYERRTVFASGLNLVSGLEVGHGGVWLGTAPTLQFIPDADDDLVPDGPPVVLLDGFGYQDTHETLNAFVWGPDGWLYGCHGVFTHSKVGAPGTPDAQRTPMNAAVWRFHPLRREFEVFAWGTSNPWGLDFDERGQAFVTACVIPHLFHVIQGARYERQAGAHFGAHVYDDIKTIADHRHYAGDSPHGGNLRSDAAGGGHAHCGALIYLGDQFPARYRGTILFDNIHGNRLNNDLLEPRGSGFVGRHGADFLLANDAWFRAVAFEQGPDGSIFFTDWYDRQACHTTRPEIWDRTNGRLYRVRHGELAPRTVDLAQLGERELVAHVTSTNEFLSRRSRTLLAARRPGPETRASLVDALRAERESEARALRLLWALHGCGGLDEPLARELLASPFPAVQAWTIQLASEQRRPEGLRVQIANLARTSPSPLVRLYVAAALQRWPAGSRLGLATILAQHAEDADDHNLPLMIWYAIEPDVPREPTNALVLAQASRIPLVTRFVIRRLAEEPEHHGLLLSVVDPQREGPLPAIVLEELERVLATRRDVRAPEAWAAVAARIAAGSDARARELARSISIAYGDERSLELVRGVLADRGRPLAERERAIEVVARARDAQSVEAVLALLDEEALRVPALAALPAFDDERIGGAVAARLAGFGVEERRAAVHALAERRGWARALFAVLDSGAVDRSCLDAIVARKLGNLGDAAVDAGLARHFGRVHATPEDKRAKIAALKAQLAPEVLARADLPRGREVFSRTCQQCHTLFGAGAQVGPDITGSNRADLDYLLSNVVDPSALVAKEHQVTMVWLQDERLLSGILKSETDSALTLVDQQGTHVIPKADVAERRLSDVSMMPEGQIEALSPEEVRDLCAYLASPAQTPIRATKDTAAKLFDGRSLAGWKGDPAVWRVEDGAIVGETQGLARNAFLASELECGDFRLTLEVKLEKDAGNSGIQFRSQPLADGEVRGYQADVGPGWWGALYEEEGRGLLSQAPPADGRVVAGGWNTYEILALGARVRTALNGRVCADLDDPQGARRGVLALQVHSGGPTKVAFRNLKLELDPTPELLTTGGTR